MTTKIIFSECSMPFWIDVATKLAHENAWEPCYWTGDPKYEQAVKRRFPEIIFQDGYHAVRGIIPPECTHLNLPALDQELLENLSFHESIVLTMMNRMDPAFSFSYQERHRLYHFYLRYWSAVLDHFRPEIFITPVSPHLVYDYVLYVLCQKRGVKTIMFKQVALLGLIFPVQAIEDDSETIISSYREKLSSYDVLKPVTLSPESEIQLEKLSSSYTEAIPVYMQKQFKGSRQLLNFSSYPYYLKRAYEIAFGARSQRSYLKKRGKRIEDAAIMGLEFLFYEIVKANWMIKRRLRRHYEKLAQDVDLDHSYVYVALNYQPERTTSPEGGVFVDQSLMVALLSKSIPSGWYLYVKEHPSQFLPSTSGSRSSRSTDFYDDLMALPNVKLVSLSSSPFDLIDNAKAVATVTGTVGWESVVRGKPVLCFGYAWYRGCDGVFYTPTWQRCRASLSMIESGYKVNHERVRMFVHVLEQECIRGYLNKYWAERTGLSRERNASEITRAIQRLVLS